MKRAFESQRPSFAKLHQAQMLEMHCFPFSKANYFALLLLEGRCFRSWLVLRVSADSETRAGKALQRPRHIFRDVSCSDVFSGEGRSSSCREKTCVNASKHHQKKQPSLQKKEGKAFHHVKLPCNGYFGCWCCSCLFLNVITAVFCTE